MRCDILPTVSPHFWSSPSATWRLARFGVVVFAGFGAPLGVVDVWIAMVAGMVAAILLLIDEVLSRRAGDSDRAGSASA